MKTNKNFKVIFAVFVALAAVPAIAAVGGMLQFHSIRTTEVSGHSGKEATLSFGKNAFITGITWSEHKDHPCYFKIDGLQYKNGAWKPVSKEWAKNCAYKKSSAKNTKFYHPGNNAHAAMALNKLEVCTSRKKGSTYEKLKGLRIWATQLKPNGKFQADNSMEDEWRTNCKDWGQQVKCNADEVAVGLKLRYYDWESAGAVRGVALKCAKVKRIK